MLYECLAGQRAILGPNTEALKEVLRAARIAPLEVLRPNLPEGLAAVVHRAFSRNPQDRFAGAAEFRAALAPYDDEAIGGALGIASMVRGLFGA